MESGGRVILSHVQLLVSSVPCPIADYSRFDAKAAQLPRGIVNCYGGFQAYYMTKLFPDMSPAAISWIGSLQAFLLIFISVLTGPAYDAGYFQPLIVTGTVLMAFGTLLVSFCSQYWQLLLAQSLCTGLGAGCLFVPGVAILSTYFKKHASLAIGIATSGGSVGTYLHSLPYSSSLLNTESQQVGLSIPLFSNGSRSP
jgi:MFS family permease